MNATPRPWDFEGMTIIEKATRKRLMVLSNALGSDGVMEHEGNCEILLNAVNSFDAMKEALRETWLYLNDGTPDADISPAEKRVRQLIQKALASTGEEVNTF